MLDGYIAAIELFQRGKQEKIAFSSLFQLLLLKKKGWNLSDELNFLMMMMPRKNKSFSIQQSALYLQQIKFQINFAKKNLLAEKFG